MTAPQTLSGSATRSGGGPNSGTDAKRALSAVFTPLTMTRPTGWLAFIAPRTGLWRGSLSESYVRELTSTPGDAVSETRAIDCAERIIRREFPGLVIDRGDYFGLRMGVADVERGKGLLLYSPPWSGYVRTPLWRIRSLLRRYFVVQKPLRGTRVTL
jgi:hypothetical protein